MRVCVCVRTLTAIFLLSLLRNMLYDKLLMSSEVLTPSSCQRWRPEYNQETLGLLRFNCGWGVGVSAAPSPRPPSGCAPL